MSDNNNLNEEKWHMKKEINVAHIFTTVTFLVFGLLYLSDMDKRISANEITITHIEKQRSEDIERTQKQLEKIDKKLDQLIESNRR